MRGHAMRWVGLGIVLGLLAMPSLVTSGQSASTLTVPVSQWAQDLAVRDDVAYGVTVDDREAAIVVGTSGIVKYARSGELVWTASYGGTAFDVATDRLLDVTVAGTEGLTKYSSSGQRLWTIHGRYQGVAVAREDRIVALGEDAIQVIDPSGSILGALAYPGTPTAVATDDPGDRAIVVGNAGLAAYSPVERTRRWLRDAPQDARDVALSSDGEILVASARGVVKYGPRGHRQWRVPSRGEARAVTPVPRRQPLQAEPGGSGDALLVSGHHRSGGDSDYLVAKYDGEGNLLWNVREDGGYGRDDFAHDVAAGADNRLYVTGTITRQSRDSRADQALSQDYYTIQYAEQPLPATQGEACGVDARPTADFVMSPEAPRAGQAVQFRDRSSDADGHIMAWHWDFGDGTQRRSQAPRHSFARNARYTVALTVVDNDFCTATVEREIAIGGSAERPEAPPSEGFDWTVEAQGELDAGFDWATNRETRGTYPRGFAPSIPTDVDTVQFRDQSISGARGVTVHFRGEAVDPNDRVVQWRWDFGDGVTSSRANPTHTYDQTGRYVVTLTVTTDADATRTYEATLDLRDVGGAPITAYRWSFGDGASSEVANPTHDYGDDGTYRVTLTVRDAQGNSDTATQTIEVRNVPPVPHFDWVFDGFPEGPPSCPTGELEPRRFPSYRPLQSEFGATMSCQEPTMPTNAGALALVDRSQDGEPWQELDSDSRSWAFEGAEAVCGPTEGGDETSCFTDPRPTVGFLTSMSEAGPILYRGPVTVDLTVQDDDGATSTRSSTIDVANIPPYAMFEWFLGEPFPAPSVLDSRRSSALDGPVPHQFGGESTPACDSCAGTYGPGEPQQSATSNGGNLTVTRTIRSESCGFEGSPSAICGVRSEFFVDVTVQATDIASVRVDTTVPSGWSASCFAEGISCEGAQVNGTLSFEGSGTSTRSYSYQLDPQWWRGSAVTFGAHTIQGTFTEIGETAGESVSLSNQVVLCDRVNAEPTVNFHGLDAEDVESRFRGFPLDLNGDAIVSYDWSFGRFGLGNGQDPSGGPCISGECQFALTNLACSYTSTEFESGWRWSSDVNVDLTVTDEGGASTMASTTVPLGGPCGEGEIAE